MISLLPQSWATGTISSRSITVLPQLFFITRQFFLLKRWKQLLFLLTFNAFTVETTIAQECQVQVSTLAGSGSIGFDNGGFLDGAAWTARFNRPTGIAVDEQGNMYIADTWNHRIRKISTSGLVTTLAGTGNSGFMDGSGETAQFRVPTGVAVDGQGNVYVADRSSHRIRKIDTNGLVTTLAGSGTRGFMDGASDLAMFNFPADITVDEQGNLYVADELNHRIRKVDTNGLVTTLAGNETSGFMDGSGETAQFNRPYGIAVDQESNVYVADVSNHRVRKIAVSGQVTTLAGNGTIGYTDGTGEAVQFSFPSGVSVDKQGNVYVADASNHRIRVIDANGLVTTLAGSTYGYADGIGVTARFGQAPDIAVDSEGNVYVADEFNHRIRKIDCISCSINAISIASCTSNEMNDSYTADVTVTFAYPPATGNLVLSEDGNATVAVEDLESETSHIFKGVNLVTGDGGIQLTATFDGETNCSYTATNVGIPSAICTCPLKVSTLAGTGNSGFMDGSADSARFDRPTGIAVDETGNVYVADRTYRMRKINVNGLVTTIAGSGIRGFMDGPSDAARFDHLSRIALDKQGNVYVADRRNHRIRKVDTNGLVTTIAGNGAINFMDGPGDQAMFNYPADITVDEQGNIYVADLGNHRIRKIDTNGLVTTLAGDGTAGFKDGIGETARFYNPNGIAVDERGNVYVADYNNSRIRKIDSSGLVITLAGSGIRGFMDGPGDIAQFNYLAGLAVDGVGNVYVTDHLHRVRWIDTNGFVRTLAGSSTGGYMDGATSTAQFSGLTDVAVDGVGNVYVTDEFNHRIRKIACISCSINAINIASLSDCIPDGDNSSYTADVTITFSDIPTSGNLVLSGDGSATVNVESLGNSTSHTFTGVNLIAHGGAVELTATFDAETTCSYTETNAGTAPAACNLSTDQCNRAAIVEDYNTNFLGSIITAAELGWTGNVENCTAGTVSSTAINKNLQRVNYFRRLCGLSDNITFDNTKNQKCQEAALIMDANNRLSHYPTSSWNCFSDDGSEGALRSNLGWVYGTDLNPISYQYIYDPGASNTAVGHRRWILYSRSEEMGVGFTDKNHALWVTGSRGVTQFSEFIAYPPKGFVPAPLVYPRWSFGIPNAFFGSATVSMSFGNQAIPLTIVHRTGGAGDPTIVWEPEGIITDSQFDLTYTVNINNVNIGGMIQDFSYEVTLINPVHPPACPDGLQWSDNACACTANSITLRNVIPEGIYRAKDIKVVDGVVLSETTVELRAENTISILPNTEVQLGASFSAVIIPSTNVIPEDETLTSNSYSPEVIQGLPPNEPPTFSAAERSSTNPQNDIFSLEVAPNPIQNQATISYFLSESEKTKITINHISGKIIYQQASQQNKGIHHFVWDATTVPTGLYYVSLRQGIHQKVVKIIVSR